MVCLFLLLQSDLQHFLGLLETSIKWVFVHGKEKQINKKKMQMLSIALSS